MDNEFKAQIYVLDQDKIEDTLEQVVLAKNGKVREYDIDTSKLEEGMVIKNKKELGKLIGDELLKGNSKVSQINNWKRFFDYETIGGNKIVITEIYDEPFPTYDLRKLKDSLYIKYIEKILVGYFDKDKSDVLIRSKSRLFLDLGMVNENYSELSNDYNRLPVDMEFKDIDNSQLDFFYSYTYLKLSNILKKSLRSMQNRLIIICSDEYLITKYDEYATPYEVIATEDEKQDIITIEHTVLNEMGYNFIQQIMGSRNTIKQFYKKVNDKLYQVKGWKSAYRCYKIIKCDDIAKSISFIDEEIRRMTRTECRRKLSEEVSNNIIQQISDKYTRDVQKYLVDKDGWGTLEHSPNSKKINPAFHNEKCVDNQKSLVKLTMDYDEKQKLKDKQ